MRYKTPVHGHKTRACTSPTYQSWKSMRQRATNRNAGNAARYIERGITCCPEWSDFTQFLEDMGERPEGTTLDRIDNDGEYSPTNCRWATKQEQDLNKAAPPRTVSFKGKTLTFAQWEEETGIHRRTIKTRLRRGWTVARALTT